MSVNSVSAAAPVVPVATTNRTNDRAAARPSEMASLVELDEKTNQPVPPRYPWLSRLARELEPASKQPSPYGSVAILGESLDKQA